MEFQKSEKKAEVATALAGEESAKCKSAEEVIESLTAQVSFRTRFVCTSLFVN